MSTNENAGLERMLIGNVMIRGHLEPFERQLAVESFAIGPHKQLWGAILAMDEAGEEITTVTVHRRASRGKEFIFTLSDVSNLVVGLTSNTKRDDIQELRNLHSNRKLERFAAWLYERAKEGEPPKPIIEDALKFLTSLSEEQVADRGNAKHVAEVFAEDVMPRIVAMEGGEQVKVPTGFECLDDHLGGGIGIGELCVLGAKPKTGKSAIMLQMARQAAEKNNAVYICSREMLNYENGFRLIVQESQALGYGHFGPKLPEHVVEESDKAIKSLSGLPLYLDDRSRTVDEILKEVRILKGQGVDLKGVFVDYAQLMAVDDPFGKTRANILDMIVYGLKDLAMQEDLAVTVLAQFNREGIEAQRPKMYHFEGSSSIEKAGNIVILWTLGGTFGGERSGSIWIEAARSSPFGEWNLEFTGHKARFKLS
ncbi:MAG TPA: DnaB-like helicase C-terminal domain-containing protein [Aridibacter sp.]|nr:DnaB-like helicase C-terminal domain-containing protein [Aridibacter sp.]